MHELGITQNIVAIVTECAEGRKVQRVLLEIGKLSAIMPDAVRFCFDVISQNTVLEAAKLEIIETNGIAKCLRCENEFSVDKPFGKCSCGSNEINLIAGEELKIKEIEIEEICV
ncbi:MAG: hydrogenase maturation nickel metallochaperone HypA [Cyanobacteria bacterium P01_A01_bin.45]